MEVKVLGGSEPRIRCEHLWQLLCYAAPDWVGEQSLGIGHDIRAVAIWELPRQFRWEISLDEVAHVTCGQRWAQARDRLLRHVAEARPG